MATLMGACIGFERQWRQRMAGLRTNTLVAIGAASFVVFSGLFPGEDSPTRMAAQVVSGIGFLGAGIIFREGLHVTGLNTAATLWCSAAVGLLAGSGHPLHAALATGFVVLVNLTLRPLVRIINRQPKPTCITASASSAEVRKRRISGPCSCKAPATDSSACGGLKAMTWRKAGASKSLRSSRPSPRATPFLNRSSAA
jgi:uncharacterized membrane protein YhiD involved in acid resistance